MDGWMRQKKVCIHFLSLSLCFILSSKMQAVAARSHVKLSNEGLGASGADCSYLASYTRPPTPDVSGLTGCCHEEANDVEETFADWLVIFVGYGLLLFPFPGWVFLYIFFNEVNLLAPIFGTVFSILSIRPGVYLLAQIRQNSVNGMNTWILYAAIVSLLCIGGLLLTIGLHPIDFSPIAVFLLSLWVAWRARRKVREEANLSAPQPSSVTTSTNRGGRHTTHQQKVPRSTSSSSTVVKSAAAAATNADGDREARSSSSTANSPNSNMPLPSISAGV